METEEEDWSSYGQRASTRPAPVPKWTDGLCGFWTIIGVIIFCAAAGLAFVIPNLDNEGIRLPLDIGVALCSSIALVLAFLVQQMDPGIVPPCDIKDPEILQAEHGSVSPDLVIDSHGQWARRKLLSDGRSEITHRYCSTCNLWRQPRTSHCSRCGYCMERFDHHCGAMGTCVAKKNHRFFTAFLFFASFGAGQLLLGSILYLKQEDWTRGVDSQRWQTYVILLLSLVYFYTSLLFFFALMHCTILLCDCTTKQYLKSRQGRGSAWPKLGLKSWMSNMHGVCCGEVRSKYKIMTFESFGRSQPVSTV